MDQPNSAEACAWPRGIAAITLFVADLSAARLFYSRVFNRMVLYEDADSAVFRFGATLVNLLKRTAVPELVEPETVGRPGAGARFVLTLYVDVVDATCAELAARGVELLNGPIDRPWGVRTASFLDPDGYIWEIAK